MKNALIKSGKIGLIIAIVIFFTVSIILSARSFSGYVINDETNNGANMASLAFFMLGLLCSFFYLSRFRKR